MEMLHIQENPRVLDNVALLVLLTLRYWFPKCGPGTSRGPLREFQGVPNKSTAAFLRENIKGLFRDCKFSWQYRVIGTGDGLFCKTVVNFGSSISDINWFCTDFLQLQLDACLLLLSLALFTSFFNSLMFILFVLFNCINVVYYLFK